MDRHSTVRNYSIEFYRFLFACIIYVLHVRKYENFSNEYGEFNGGYLAEEFFFILSGFLMMGSICSQKIKGEISPERMAENYFILRYKKLMPQY